MSGKIVANSWNGSGNYDHVTLEIDGVMTTIVTYRHASDTPKFVEQVSELIKQNGELQKEVESWKRVANRRTY